MKKSKSLSANALLNGIKQCSAIFFQLITFPYISRILGNEGLGKYSFSASIVSYFLLIASFGISTYGVREGARKREDADELQKFSAQLFSINICSTIFSYLLLFLCICISTKLKSYALYIAILSIAMVLNTIGTDWINTVFEDYLYITIRYIVMQMIALVSIFLFVKSENDVYIYCIIYLIASAGGNICNIFYIRKYLKIRFTPYMNIKMHFSSLFVFFINSVAISVYVNSDITMLGLFYDNSTVGIYSLASRVYLIIKQLINAVIIVIVPRVAYIIEKNIDAYEEYVRNAFRVLSIILIPIAVGACCISNDIVMIVGGEEYIQGANILRVLCIALVFAMYASIFTNCILIVKREEKKCLVSTILSALLNISLNIILLPDIGMLGAAITTVCAEVLNIILQAFFSRKYFKWNMSDFSVIKPCIIGSMIIILVCGVCNYAIKSLLPRVLIAILFSVVAYIYSLLVLDRNLSFNKKSGI